MRRPAGRNAWRSAASPRLRRDPRSPSSCSTSGGITGSSVMNGASSRRAQRRERRRSVSITRRALGHDSSRRLSSPLSMCPVCAATSRIKASSSSRISRPHCCCAWVMRRAGVASLTATIVAAAFVLFGPGEENIVWAFQFTFVGALMFGLVHLILSDHDGPIDRRDQLGLLAGVASLMCSGVSLVLVGVVGLAVVVRCGWRPAVFHTVPLGALYVDLVSATTIPALPTPYGRSANARELLRFVWSGMRWRLPSDRSLSAVRDPYRGDTRSRLDAVLTPLRSPYGCDKGSRRLIAGRGCAVPDRYRIHPMVRHTGRRQPEQVSLHGRRLHVASHRSRRRRDRPVAGDRQHRSCSCCSSYRSS